MGISNIQVKRVNKRKIFNYILERREVSMPMIVADLRVSGPTVLQNVNELVEERLVEESGIFKSTGGRRAKALSVNVNAKYSIGIDITLNHVSMVITNLNGDILKHTRVQKPFIFENNYYLEIVEKIDNLIEDVKIDREKILGVGFSIPGIINYSNNKIEYSHVLNIFDKSIDSISDNIPFDCRFINDAKAATLAQMYGEKADQSKIYISLSNTIGGAFITPKNTDLNKYDFENKLYFGQHWRGSEFGHMTLVPNGEQCYCHKKGCFDAYCNAKVLGKHTNGNLDDFFLELKNGNKEFNRIWEEYLYNLAIQINSLRMAYDCDIILGGYVGNYMGPYLDMLREICADLNTFERDAQYINKCKYRIEAAAFGAALQHIGKFIDNIQ